MLLSFIKNKKIALLGIGRSTLSTYNFLSNKGFSLYIWDDNPEVRAKYKNSFLNIVNINNWDYSSLDAIITSPGIALYYPKPHDIIKKVELYNLPLLTDLELFYYFFPNYKYIGVTGSNGKSTLSTLLYNIFTLAGKSVVLAGNIGIPIFNLGKLPLNTYVILELSSFQLSFLKKMKFDIAVLLNIYPNHNDYHGSYLNYQQSKFNIFKNQTANNTSIINLDEEYIGNLFASKVINSQLITISPTGENNSDYFFKCSKLYKKSIKDSSNNLVYDFTREFNTNNKSFLQLILFAYAVCSLLRIDINIFITAIKQFKGLPHRQEVVEIRNNVIFINDSKATTPLAAFAALEKYSNIYWLVGGVRKSGDFNICEPFFYKVKHVFIFGKDRDSFAKELKDKVNFSCYNTLKEATIAAFNAIKKDLVHKSKINSPKDNIFKVVLLSPVGASFDEFKNFECRGNFFKKTIKELINATI